MNVLLNTPSPASSIFDFLIITHIVFHFFCSIYNADKSLDRKNNSEYTKGQRGPSDTRSLQLALCWYEILDPVIYRMPKSYTTSNFQLDEMMKKAIGDRFLGVFSRDQTIPTGPDGSSFIVNLEGKDDGGGTHWAAGYWDKKKPGLPELYYFDSYGSEPVQEVRDLVPEGKLMYSDLQMQAPKTTTCGFWTMSWIKQMSRPKENKRDLYYSFLYRKFKPFDKSGNNEKILKKQFNLS